MTTANIWKGGLLAGALMLAMAGSGQAMPASMALAGNASPPITARRSSDAPFHGRCQHRCQLEDGSGARRTA